MKGLLLGLTLTVICNAGYACYSPPVTIAELNGQPIVRILSENTKYLLEMHPARWLDKNKKRSSSDYDKFTVTKESLGIVYSVAEDGMMTPAWEVKGIYPIRFRSGMFPFFPERFTFYVSNDGSKVVSVLDKKWDSETLFSIYEQSGTVKELGYLFLTALSRIPACGGRQILSSHHLRVDDILEFEPRLKRTKASETWELSVHTGELKKQPN